MNALAQLVVAAALVVLLVPGTVAASAATSEAGAGGPTVVPASFLRQWDPVTVFFAEASGPPAGGPCDDPSPHVLLRPPHPGAWRWLDGRTLQFRPADPWPPLGRVEVVTGGRVTRLVSLLSPPERVEPADGSVGLAPVSAVRLVFPAVVEPASLAAAVSVELRPLPGLDAAAARWLTGADLTVKAMERRSVDESPVYELRFREPVPAGVRATLRLALSPDATCPDQVARVTFETAVPFRVVSAGTGWRQLPLAAAGSSFGPDEALQGAAGNREVSVVFSAEPAAVGPLEVRSLVRFSPAVESLSFDLSGTRLRIRGDFRSDTLYRVDVGPAPVSDATGRPLETGGTSSFHVHFPARSSELAWTEGRALVELHGPRMVPVRARGVARADLRIHRIDALDRSLWPFPSSPVAVDESLRPPGPGEEPPDHSSADARVSSSLLARHLQALGAPLVSEMLDLPVRRDGGATSFGIDLSSWLVSPGAYLVGLRRLDGSSTRSWIRVEVTDLCLTTVEEPRGVRFLVTSLATGRPVAGARILVEGPVAGPRGRASFGALVEGVADGEGAFTWPAPAEDVWRGLRPGRIVVSLGEDRLVLDPLAPPEGFAEGSWSSPGGRWLAWRSSVPAPEVVAHVFTERPLYRPDETVHVKGWIRRRVEGRLTAAPMAAWLRVSGPGDLEWTEDLEQSEGGGVDADLTREKLPTGSYRLRLEDKDGRLLASTGFQMEEYRIPRFEVRLDGPDRVPLDRPFRIALGARYYAGGTVTARPVSWRVTQFPAPWRPAGAEGFLFSSDSRFGGGAIGAVPATEHAGLTDADGAASLTLDPALEATAHPRAYVVEATVTGVDDATVTATHKVTAVPPFAVGVRVPRVVRRDGDGPVEAALLVVGHDDRPEAGRDVTVRLLRRRWHAHLQAGDFAAGDVKYVTDVVDEPVFEGRVVSGSAPSPLSLPVDGAGVWLLSCEARDRQGRTQTVTVDFFVTGTEPVTWKRPADRLLAVTTDRPRYAPGDEATLVIQSPFQEGEALVVLEEPAGNRYARAQVENGVATWSFTVAAAHVPRVPVHVLLRRGRRAGGPPPTGTVDPAKPATVAQTVWVGVEPVTNKVAVSLDVPTSAWPGQRVGLAVRLADEGGRPLAGEVALWLVDEAVLSLAPERPLDPLPSFLASVRSRLLLRDTRNLTTGWLPVAELPGGDAGEEESMRRSSAEGLLERASVRRRFLTVPYWNPSLAVGPGGEARVEVELPDNLTVFRVRAVAAAGWERFGTADGRIDVRLPLTVQPSLPRFVRPGDRFDAVAVGRVVEGPGGEGALGVTVDGLAVEGPAKRPVTWTPGTAQRLAVPVTVVTPRGVGLGAQVTFSMAVSRLADGATDAFEVRVPVRPDRAAVTERTFAEAAPGASLTLAAPAGGVRNGTFVRRILVSRDGALVRMAAALDVLLAYPWRCTEQRVARARAGLALRRFAALTGREDGAQDLDGLVRELLATLPDALDSTDRCAFWPGGAGSTVLSAWVLDFLVEARQAGHTVDATLWDRVVRGLESTLRRPAESEADGDAWAGRTWALAALTAAGRSTDAWSAELARRARWLDLEGVANVVLALADRDGGTARSRELVTSLWDGLSFRTDAGRPVFSGLAQERGRGSEAVLPSEARTLARVYQALSRSAAGDARLSLVRDGLVRLGTGGGFGSTNADAAALTALAAAPTAGGAGASRVLSFTGPGLPARASLAQGEALGAWVTTAPAAVTLAVDAGMPLAVQSLTSFVPEAPGAEEGAVQSGFAVTRELLLVGGAGAPMVREALDAPGRRIRLAPGQVVEDHVQLVNPELRHHVAVEVPLAAGLELLNPRLATSPPEARAAGRNTVEPTFASWRDDGVAYFFDVLPAGTFDLYVRARAQTPGTFTQPAARAEMMYRRETRGSSPGAWIEVSLP